MARRAATFHATGLTRRSSQPLDRYWLGYWLFVSVNRGTPRCLQRWLILFVLSADGLVMAEAAFPHGARGRPGEQEPTALNRERFR
jgi:hypothetical protein